jgi:MFS family permease
VNIPNVFPSKFLNSKSPTAAAAAAAMKAPPSSPAVSSNAKHINLILLTVFLDMVGVALVVPSLIFRWKDVGISTERLGAVQSIYSVAQLVGGMAIGYLGDRVLGRKDVLLLSFGGSAVSYWLVGTADSVELLVLSRVIVGLVKQTMTCASALLTRLSSDATRAQIFGRLSSASTAAFLAGQSVGGVLSSRFGRRVPCYVASALFLVNVVLIACFLPNDRPSRKPPADNGAGPDASAPAADSNSCGGGSGSSSGSAESSAAMAMKFAPTPRPPPATPAAPVPSTWHSRLVSNLGGFASAFRGVGGRVLTLRLLYAFLMRSTYALHSVYETQRWDLTPADTGFLSSYKQVNAMLPSATECHRVPPSAPFATECP